MFTRHFAHWPPGLPRTLRVPRTTIHFNLEVSARRYGDSAAVDYYGNRVTYGELKRQTDAIAGFLQRRCGVTKGDRVLLYCQNGLHFIIGYYAILRADAVVVPVNPMTRSEELRHYIGDAQAAVMIAASSSLRSLSSWRKANRTLVRLVSDVRLHSAKAALAAAKSRS